MDSALPYLAAASKVDSVLMVSWALVVAGGIICLLAWLWLVYQNFRFSPIHGVLSVVIPVWALLYAFFRMEHCRKSQMIAACLIGIVVGALGYALLYSGWVCEYDDECMDRQMTDEVIQEAEGESCLEPPTLNLLNG